jgi:hypothetical protein
MKLLLITALLFSNVAYGQPKPDNNTSTYNVSKQHIQQKTDATINFYTRHTTTSKSTIATGRAKETT